jgi:hypothetical protein
MIRLSAAYASNTSMGSTNNFVGTPGGGHGARDLSPNTHTLDQLSNASVSPNTDMKSNSLLSRMPYHQQQLIVGAGGQMQ